MALTAQEVYRDFVTDGVPASGNNDPSKSAIRTLLGGYERVINAFLASGGKVYTSRAELDADLAHAADTMAWVVGDGTAENNGIYQKQGASGAGSWTRIADLPYSFIVANDAGAGTPDALVATSDLPVSSSALVLLNIFETNVGSPVTVAFNGGTPLTVKSNTGNDIAPGGLQSGMLVLGRVSGSTFRLVSDQVSAAIIAQAEDAAHRAEAAAAGLNLPTIQPGDAGKTLSVNGDETGYEFAPAVPTITPGDAGKAIIVKDDETGFELGSGGGGGSIASRADLQALAPTAGEGRYLTEAGREGWFVFRSGDFSTLITADTLQGVYVPPTSAPTGASGCWIRQRQDLGVHVDWFGTVGNGSTNDRAAIQAAIDLALRWSSVVRFADKDYFIGSALVVTGAAWRSISFEGTRTGNHQTVETYATNGRSGTVIVTNTATSGNHNALEVNFNSFTNENFSLRGLHFRNNAMDKVSGGLGVKVSRGPANGRYIDGHTISDCSFVGFAAGLAWYGMNSSNALLNFFGRIILERVAFRGCGIGWLQNNCGCNLVSMYDTLFFECPYGGISCTAGAKGSMISVSLWRCHMEGVGGMFRTATTGLEVSPGVPSRNKISLHDFTHEVCGSTVSGGTATGDPFALGINTDVYIVGVIDNGPAYGESQAPSMGGATNTLTALAKCQFYLSGAINNSPAGMVTSL